jgi:hypothetical protein
LATQDKLANYQTLSDPVSAVLNGLTFVVFKTTNTVNPLQCTCSPDGKTWSVPHPPLDWSPYTVSNPSIVIYKNQLFVFASMRQVPIDPSVFMASSYDDYDWTKWRNTGLDAWPQNVTVYQNQLIMVWSSLHDSNIWYGTSTDSLKWEIVGKTGGNTTTNPPVTTIKVQDAERVIMVYCPIRQRRRLDQLLFRCWWLVEHATSTNLRIEFEFPHCHDHSVDDADRL